MTSLASVSTCPHCNANLQDEDGGSRVIGVEYQGGYDGVSEWQCADCGYRQGRWSGKELVGDEREVRYGGAG